MSAFGGSTVQLSTRLVLDLQSTSADAPEIIIGPKQLLFFFTVTDDEDEDDDDEEEEEEVDYFGEADDGGEVRGARDILYSDFFEPPALKQSKKSKKAVRFEEDGEDESKFEDDEFSADAEEEGTSDGEGGTSVEEEEGLEGVVTEDLGSGYGTGETEVGLEGEDEDEENLSKHEKKQLMVRSIMYNSKRSIVVLSKGGQPLYKELAPNILLSYICFVCSLRRRLHPWKRPT